MGMSAMTGVTHLVFSCGLVACAVQALDGLPDPLKLASGERLKSPEEWAQKRRPEVLELFRTHVYGRAPVGRPDDLKFEAAPAVEAMDGKALRKDVSILFSGPGGKGRIRLLLFVPKNKTKPAPVFLLICHRGADNIDPTRKVRSPFWPAETLIERGYAAAAFHINDVDPDKNDGFKDGVHKLFDQGARGPDAWGTLGSWAWGASRCMDYLETDPDIDAKRCAVVGHSRGGKAALWCGAQDERFALPISNESGGTGAQLARMKRGEVRAITKYFPYWFCEKYKSYADKEDDLPVDQHELIALMAPRLVYVASAELDQYSHPQGELQACVEASAVYAFLGQTGLSDTSPAKADTPIHGGRIGYHMRAGKHDMTEYDWKCFIDFADGHWRTAK